MKTPEEIKQGLECCCDGNIACTGRCVYEDDWCFPDCKEELQRDAIAYIRQLEREKTVLIAAMRHGCICKVCKHFGKKMNEEPCGWCGGHYDSFEFRGVEDENHGENR